jgi:hypothetical protein
MNPQAAIATSRVDGFARPFEDLARLLRKTVRNQKLRWGMV